MAFKSCLWWTWLTLMASSSLAEIDCCSKDVIWESGKNCSDGSQVSLVCPNKMYLIDQGNPSDQFNVDNENGSWLVLTSESDEIRIPQNEFCISKKNESKELIALVCFGETQNSGWKYILFGSLSVTSCCFLFITLVVYAILPELREIQDKAMMSAVASLTASYMILAIQHLRKVELPTSDGKIEDDVMCLPLAFIMYYAFLSAFFWLNLVAFNIWRLVWFKTFPIKETILFATFCFIGWGAPMCFLITALVTQFLQGPHQQPLFGNIHCWFKGDFETLAYFYGPISILLMVNVVYLSLTCWRLWHEYQESSGNKVKSLRKKCLLYVKLILVMGITWIFEIIAFFTGPHYEAWVLTDILNSLQGVIIFVIFVATRKRVRKLLAQKKPFGISFPKSWTAYEDEECEEIEIVFSEEVELSQSS